MILRDVSGGNSIINIHPFNQGSSIFSFMCNQVTIRNVNSPVLWPRIGPEYEAPVAIFFFVGKGIEAGVFRERGLERDIVAGAGHTDNPFHTGFVPDQGPLLTGHGVFKELPQVLLFLKAPWVHQKVFQVIQGSGGRVSRGGCVLRAGRIGTIPSRNGTPDLETAKEQFLLPLTFHDRLPWLGGETKHDPHDDHDHQCCQKGKTILVEQAFHGKNSTTNADSFAKR
jgi:hypothetical protein